MTGGRWRIVIIFVVTALLIAGCKSPSSKEVTLPTTTPSPVSEPSATEEPDNETSAAAAEPDSATEAEPDSVAEAESTFEQEGIATYLSDALDGQPTASGALYDKDAMVAAHASLPFDTQVIVTNLDNGQVLTVTIVDRLPEKVEAVIDVSSAAAAELGMLDNGSARVRIDLADQDAP